MYCDWGKEILAVGDSVIKVKGKSELTLIKKNEE
jgi:hypothetical protein